HSLRPPLALHSFPTRRSSDLQSHGRGVLQNLTIAGKRNHESLIFRSVNLGNAIISNRKTVLRIRNDLFKAKRSTARYYPLRTFRSEEHTSELQSRENLVCRLL